MVVYCMNKKAGESHCVFIGRKKENIIYACITPWSLLQTIPYLHYSCLLDRLDHTTILIRCDEAIREIQFYFSSFERSMWPTSSQNVCFIRVVYNQQVKENSTITASVFNNHQIRKHWVTNSKASHRVQNMKSTKKKTVKL